MMLPSEIVEQGWVKGTARIGNSHCALDAIEKWGRDNGGLIAQSNYLNSLKEMLAYRTNRFGDPFTVTSWNDDPFTTKSEVVNTLIRVETMFGLERKDGLIYDDSR